jgi:transcriptional regulator with XRE-family HTH domain
MKGNEVLIKIGKEIRKVRYESGLTQTQLADMVGTTQSMIGKYERGEIDLSLIRFIEIAIALKTAPYYFLSTSKIKTTS